MKRDLTQLTNHQYDILVIGAGIHGACVAWDAALRGLSVALVDKGDFGHATSANSLKIMHGGLRYLQDGNLSLMRTMIHERRAWLCIAPHLVHPLSCLMPTDTTLLKHRYTMHMALAMNALVSWDRNHHVAPNKHLPYGRVLSKDQFCRLLPDMSPDGITGGIIWHDAQIYHTERLVLAVVLAAGAAGATLANYVEVTGFTCEGQTIQQVQAQDGLTGDTFAIRAKMVINCAGAGSMRLLGLLHGRVTAPKVRLSTAMNIVTRQVLPKIAVGLPSRYTTKDAAGKAVQRSRLLFMTPWRDVSVIGTVHTPCPAAASGEQELDRTIDAFLDEINRAYPGAALTRKDLYHVHWGYLPAVDHANAHLTVKLLRQGEVHDHGRNGDIANLITVVGVKYTTARAIAQRAVTVTMQKLGCRPVSCCTDATPVSGGRIEHFDRFLIDVLEKSHPKVNRATMQHLAYTYGDEYSKILTYVEHDCTLGEPVTPSSPVIRAEIVHAVREEMALKLTDVIQRRTELGTAGKPDDACLDLCAAIMAHELGWSPARCVQEIGEVQAGYALSTIQAKDL